jgi:hypothetical protein
VQPHATACTVCLRGRGMASGDQYDRRHGRRAKDYVRNLERTRALRLISTLPME